MAVRETSALVQIRRMIRDAPAIALIAGAVLGPPPGLDPPVDVLLRDEAQA